MKKGLFWVLVISETPTVSPSGTTMVGTAASVAAADPEVAEPDDAAEDDPEDADPDDVAEPAALLAADDAADVPLLAAVPPLPQALSSNVAEARAASDPVRHFSALLDCIWVLLLGSGGFGEDAGVWGWSIACCRPRTGRPAPSGSDVDPGRARSFLYVQTIRVGPGSVKTRCGHGRPRRSSFVREAYERGNDRRIDSSSQLVQSVRTSKTTATSCLG
ncbi:hypothetical protein GCM10009818_18140 [Nakamurella flavida]